MSTRDINLRDMQFPIAKSRSSPVETNADRELPNETAVQVVALAEAPQAVVNAELLISPEGSDQSAPMQRSDRRGGGIRALRGHRKQSSVTMFNVALDEPLKNRLTHASFEQQVKQTVIVRAAIDAFLKKEGY